MTPPLIMVAPTGARRGKADHPALPLTLPEIVSTARACHQAGAGALHLHVRDEAGQHSLDPARYREALDELAQQVPEMLVQITTESAGIYDVPAQLDCLARLCPKWASISLREIARAPELADRVYGTCAAEGIRVQHILYDAGDFALYDDWRCRGVLRPEQREMIFVLGRYTAGQVSEPAALDAFLRHDPAPGHWSLCAFGPAEHDCLIYAAARGGQLRVGFENSLTAPDGTAHADNAASVARLKAALDQCLMEDHADAL